MSGLTQDSVINPLHLIQPHSRWIVIVALLIANAIFLGLVWFTGRTLRPRPIALELARTLASATAILGTWDKPSARRCIRTVFFLIPAYVTLFMYLCFLAADSLLAPVNWLARIGVVLGWSAILAGLFHVVENIAMLRTLRHGPSEGSVMVTKIFAWAKFGILAVAGAFLVFRAEYFVYEFFHQWVQEFPRTTISILALLTIFLGIRSLRIARNLHPPLLTLQMARSPEAAARVLQRWKPDFVSVAERANYAEMWFALGYAVTLGIVAFRISPPSAEGGLQFAYRAIARGAAWFLLLAGTLHLVQNISAAFAIQVHDAEGRRWWVGLGRRCGRLRLMLLGVGGTWLFLMFLRWEGGILRDVGVAIRRMRGT